MVILGGSHVTIRVLRCPSNINKRRARYICIMTIATTKDVTGDNGALDISRFTIWGSFRWRTSHSGFRTDIYIRISIHISTIASAIDIANRTQSRLSVTLYHVDVDDRITRHVGILTIAAAINVLNFLTRDDVYRRIGIILGLIIIRICSCVCSIVSTTIEAVDHDRTIIIQLVNIHSNRTRNDTARLVSAKDPSVCTAIDSKRKITGDICIHGTAIKGTHLVFQTTHRHICWIGHGSSISIAKHITQEYLLAGLSSTCISNVHSCCSDATIGVRTAKRAENRSSANGRCSTTSDIGSSCRSTITTIIYISYFVRAIHIHSTVRHISSITTAIHFPDTGLVAAIDIDGCASCGRTIRSQVTTAIDTSHVIPVSIHFCISGCQVIQFRGSVACGLFRSIHFHRHITFW